MWNEKNFVIALTGSILFCMRIMKTPKNHCKINRLKQSIHVNRFLQVLKLCFKNFKEVSSVTYILSFSYTFSIHTFKQQQTRKRYVIFFNSFFSNSKKFKALRKLCLEKETRQPYTFKKAKKKQKNCKRVKIKTKKWKANCAENRRIERKKEKENRKNMRVKFLLLWKKRENTEYQQLKKYVDKWKQNINRKNYKKMAKPM